MKCKTTQEKIKELRKTVEKLEKEINELTEKNNDECGERLYTGKIEWMFVANPNIDDVDSVCKSTCFDAMEHDDSLEYKLSNELVDAWSLDDMPWGNNRDENTISYFLKGNKNKK